MANTNNGRMHEFAVKLSAAKYWLYVKEGKPIRIRSESSSSSNMIYPENSDFDRECKEFVMYLYFYNKSKSLKDLYNVLGTCELKEEVKNYIDKLIIRYEKELAYLKS